MSPTPYYADDFVTIYHGDCLDMADVWVSADVLLTDPPYGIGYMSNSPRRDLPRSIEGDVDTNTRDRALSLWRKASPDRPALMFGSWKRERPEGTVALLIWDTKGALGMGDLSIPWKPSHQEIYVMGTGFTGPRTSDVLRFPPVQSSARNGRCHPHQKPTDLIQSLLVKCPDGTVADPFMGSGSTLRAAKNLGRHAVGIEIDERYCEIAAKRLAQEVLPL